MVEAFITKGILGELCGDIGEACYAKMNSVMGYPNMIAGVVFIAEQGIGKEFVGSMFFGRNSLGGKEIWILAAINPRRNFIAQHDPVDFLRGAFSYVWSIAKEEGVKTLVTPVGADDAVSARKEIKAACVNFVTGDYLTMDTPVDFHDRSAQDKIKRIIFVGDTGIR
jgi:hypothetical protein